MSSIKLKTLAPEATYAATVSATADRTEPSRKRAQQELEAVQQRIVAARLGVAIIKDWWCSGADSKTLANRYNMSEEAVIQKAMAAGMQGILLVEAVGMNEFNMYEAMAYNNQGYGLSMKAALKKAIEVEEQAQYDRDVMIYHTLGFWPAKYKK